MANTIRIKRRSTNATAPSTSEVVNGELALNEFTAGSEILYYGKGGSGSASSSVIKIGGPGAYLTFDTNQTPTGTKTFSTTTLAITGGSNTNILSTNGSGGLSWIAQASAPNVFTSFTDGTNTATADTTSDTFKLRGTAPLTVTVTNDDATHGDSALFAVSAASTIAAGITSLTDSISSTSTSTAATPNSVKSAYDIGAAALPKAGGTMTGKITTGAGGATYASVLLGVSAADPTSPVSGDLWNNTGAIKFYNGSATKTVAFLDSNITGTAGNVSGTVAVANGGTGLTSLTQGGILYATGNTNFALTSGSSFDTTNSVGTILSVNVSGIPSWTNTLDGGAY